MILRKRFLGVCVLMLVLTLLLVGACAKPAPAPAPAPTPAPAPVPAPAPAPKVEPIVLKYVFAYKEMSPDCYISRRIIEVVNERAKGELIIKNIGGPEAIPLFDQLEAVRTGVVDMSFCILGASEKLVGEYGVCGTSPFTYEEEHALGVHEFWRQFFAERMNVYYLGSGNKGHGWTFVLKEPITSPDDLAGRKLILGSGHQAAFGEEYLGAIRINIQLPETYSALQQGVADGEFMVIGYQALLKLWEVAPYFIDHLVWGGGVMPHVVNMDKWNSLPKHLQDLIQQVQLELEPELYQFMLEDDRQARQKFIDNGATPIRFSPADAEKYVSMSNESVRARTESRTDPETWAKIVKLYNNWEPLKK